MTVVLANGYGGVLFSFLSVAKLEPAVNSLEELANANNLSLIVQDKSVLSDRLLVRRYLEYYSNSNSCVYTIELIQNAESGPEKIIGDSLRANPDNLVPNLQNVKEMLLTGNYAFAFVFINSIKSS